jgi:aminoglycoside phosphotransferase (APT) family kinase protein
MSDILDAPDAIAALFEKVAPDLPPPTAVMREVHATPGIVRWSLRTRGGAVYRMKFAADAAEAARLLRGASLLPLLAARGVPAPRTVSAHPRCFGTAHALTIEARLGTGDGLSSWRSLGTPARVAVAEDAARGLQLLHRLAVADLPPLDAVPAVHRRTWRDLVVGRIERQVERLRRDDLLPADLVGRVEARLRQGADLLPADLERRPCHGAYGLDAVSVQRRAFAGLRDFEAACAGDPWMDVAYFLGSTGEPDGAPARRFLAVYAEASPPPADLSTRIDLYAGLTVLRAMSSVADLFDGDARSAMQQVTEAWVSATPRSWV